MILEEIRRKEVWQDFYSDKTERNQLTRQERNELKSFIDEEKYLRIPESFSLPVKKEIAKLSSSKKRIVYSYSSDETWALKLMARLLYRYDGKISDSCYSFRRNTTVKKAIDRILAIEDLHGKHVLKVDIHNYFNSIPVERLIAVLEEIIDDDPSFLDFLKNLLRQNRCIYDGKIIDEKRGAMAGVPLASFFANVYLLSLDEMFESLNVPYFRYSDDILLFADSKEQIDECFRILRDHIEEKGLTLNPDKVSFFNPHEPFEFLGIRVSDEAIDLSEATIAKMKGKIRRKARSLYRKRCRKSLSYDKAAQAMIRSFDNKFYDLFGNNEFTWTRFYFPLLTTSEGLHRIDEYMLEYLRYLNSGRHYKGNYRISYEHLKRLGYTPLVAEYYRWKEDNIRLLKQFVEQ